MMSIKGIKRDYGKQESQIGMRCNYLHIWFIYSCRERPSIHFTLEEPNSHFDLKCNFRQSWSQQFGLNAAQACAGWTKEGWEGEQREMGKGGGGLLLRQHPHPSAGDNSVFMPTVSKTWREASPAPTSAQHLACSDPSTHQADSENLIGLHKYQPSLPKTFKGNSLTVDLGKLRNTGEERSHSVK